MKTKFQHTLLVLLTGAFFLFAVTSADAQNRRKRTTTTKTTKTKTSITKPASPTALSVKERTIKDLLFFPYGCLTNKISNPDEAKVVLNDTFGGFEDVNNVYQGFHANASYDYTYRGVPIGLCYADWFDNRHWYDFYFDSKTEAQQFYNNLVNDVKKAGIPLTKDTVYGNMSNRKNPVSIFKQVYVDAPVLVKEADRSNIQLESAVGKYMVELGVYKKK